jgi:adenosylcobinamide-GDP ribazoletransferase
MLKTLLNSFGFLSILPTGMPDSLEDVAKKMYLFPLIGAILGLIGGFLLLFFNSIFPPSISAALGFFTLLFLTGLHHMDGLLDFGDAVIFRGPREERIRVMHDSNIGAGGFVLGLFFISIGVVSTYEYIIAGGSPVTFFIVSEALAKLAMVFSGGLGEVAFDGSGSVFIRTLHKTRWQIIVSFILTLVILWGEGGNNLLILLSIPILMALIFSWISKKFIGGISGDVFGSINEVTRTVVMVVMVWML